MKYLCKTKEEVIDIYFQRFIFISLSFMLAFVPYSSKGDIILDMLEKTMDARHKQAVLEARNKHYARSEKLFKELLKESHNSTAILADYITSLYWQYKYNDIIKAAKLFNNPNLIPSRISKIIAIAQIKSQTDLEKAFIFFKKEVIANPTSQDDIENLVNCSILLRKFDECLQLLNQHCSKKDLFINILRAKLLHNLAVHESRNNQFKKSIEHINKALELYNSIDIIEDSIIILSWAKEHKLAVEQFLRHKGYFFKSNLSFSEVDYLFRTVAQSSIELNDYLFACELYVKLIKLNPKAKYVKQQFYKQLLHIKKTEKAFGLLNQLNWKRDPLLTHLYSELLRKRAVRMARLKKYNDALKLLKKGNTLTHGENRKILFDYICVLVWAKKYKDAISMFEGLSKNIKPPYYVLKNINVAYSFEKGTSVKVTKILPITNKKSKSTYSFSDKKRKEAIAYAHAGDYNRALQLLEIGLKESPKNLKLQFDYITILVWAKKYKESVKRYEALDNNIIKPLYLEKNILTAYKELKDWEKFILIYQKLPSPSLPLKAILLSNLKSYNKSLELLNKQSEENIKKKRIHDSLLYGKSILLAQQSKFIESKQNLKKLMSDYPKNFNIIADYFTVLCWSHDKQYLTFYNSLTTQQQKKLPIYTRKSFVPLLVHYNLNKLAINQLHKIIKKEPKNFQLFLQLGRLEKQEKHFMAAYSAFSKAIKLNPDNQSAINEKYKLLSEIQAISIAKTHLKTEHKLPATSLINRIDGNEAVLRIKWNDLKTALSLLNRNLKNLNVKDSHNITNEELNSADVKRAFFDRIIVYNKLQRMNDVYDEFCRLERYNQDVPIWLTPVIMDTLLSLRKPEQSLELGNKALAKHDNSKQNHYPTNYSLLLMKYYTLLDLNNVKEAQKILDYLNKHVPHYKFKNGIYTKNWHAATVIEQNGWMSIVTNDFDKAEKHFKMLIERAPNNSDFLNALAYTHYYRGWPRMAHREFKISKTIEPTNKTALLGYIDTLNQVDRGEEARKLLNKLQDKDDFRVKDLRRNFAIQDMSKLTISATGATTSWDSWWRQSMRLEHPIKPFRTIYSEVVWSHSKENKRSKKKNYDKDIYRGRIGADWRLSKNWYSRLSLSSDLESNDHIGGGGGVTYKDDFWTVSSDVDFKTLHIPSLALHNKLYGDEWRSSVTYRWDETLNASLSHTYLSLSDNNSKNSISAVLDKQLMANERVKIRLAWRNNLELWNEEDKEIGYYSPERAFTSSLVPMLEHNWYRRYDKIYTTRVYLGGGFKNEKTYGTSPLVFLTIEEDLRFTDRLGMVFGTTFSDSPEYGDNSFGWVVYFKLEWRF